MEEHPSPVPYPVATLQGNAPEAQRVIIEGPENPIAEPINPGGGFCVDIPLKTTGEHEFRVRSQSRSGIFSPYSDPITIEFDPDAPPVEGAATCQGNAPGTCTEEQEICDDGIDNNCDNLTDDEDPQCTDCPQDIFESNDDVTAPRVEPTRHDNLQICPGDEDFYGVFANAGDVLEVRIFFSHDEGNLDLRLIDKDGSTELAKSETTTDDEMVSHEVTEEGEYHIHVTGVGDASASYVLDIRLNPSGT